MWKADKVEDFTIKASLRIVESSEDFIGIVVSVTEELDSVLVVVIVTFVLVSIEPLIIQAIQVD